jgi:hypothetical protein
MVLVIFRCVRETSHSILFGSSLAQGCALLFQILVTSYRKSLQTNKAQPCQLNKYKSRYTNTCASGYLCRVSVMFHSILFGFSLAQGFALLSKFWLRVIVKALLIKQTQLVLAEDRKLMEYHRLYTN